MRIFLTESESADINRVFCEIDARAALADLKAVTLREEGGQPVVYIEGPEAALRAFWAVPQSLYGTGLIVLDTADGASRYVDRLNDTAQP